VGHQWWIYRAQTSGPIRPSAQEVRAPRWLHQDQLRQHAHRTAAYAEGQLSQEQFTAKPGYDVALGNKARPGEGGDVNLDCCALYGLGRADVTPADQAATGSDCITIPAARVYQSSSCPRHLDLLDHRQRERRCLDVTDVSGPPGGERSPSPTTCGN